MKMYQAKTGLNYVDICEADARPFKNNAAMIGNIFYSSLLL